MLVCMFIAIGHISESDWITESWIVRLNLFDLPDPNFQIYWTGWYFVTTSITTVGYGEVSGSSWPEKLYLIVLLFIGILLFTMIQQRTRQIQEQLMKMPSIKSMKEVSKDDAIDFLFQIDANHPDAIDEDYYESLAEGKKNQFLYSTQAAF